MADEIEDHLEACVASASLRRALGAALAAIEGIRQPLDDLGEDGGNGEAGGAVSRHGDPPSEPTITG